MTELNNYGVHRCANPCSDEMKKEIVCGCDKYNKQPEVELPYFTKLIGRMLLFFLLFTLMVALAIVVFQGGGWKAVLGMIGTLFISLLITALIIKKIES